MGAADHRDSDDVLLIGPHTAVGPQATLGNQGIAAA